MGFCAAAFRQCRLRGRLANSSASASEKTDLIDVYATGATNHLTTDSDGNVIIRAGRHDEVAQVTFDYITRLPEFYYFRSVN